MTVLKSVEIVNYRSCVKTKIDFKNSLTALIGPNGVGKSNIFNAINLLSQIRRTAFGRPYARQALYHSKINATISQDQTDYKFKIDFFYDTNEYNVEKVEYVKVRVGNGSEKPIKWKEVDSDYYRLLDSVRYRASRITEKVTIRDKQIGAIFHYLNRLELYNATQFSDPTRCPIAIELDDDSYRISAKSSHELFLYHLYNTYRFSPDIFKRYLQTVGKGGIGLIDGIQFLPLRIPNSSFKIRAGGKIQKLEVKKTMIVPSIIIDGLKLSPNQLSEGSFKSLALIFYILNSRRSLLIIEEPEVCVHHGLLSSIVDLLKFSSTERQILMSTHSDYILDKLKPENLVLIKKRSKEGTKASQLDKSMSANDFRALKSYLNSQGNLGEFWKEGGFEDA
jgi:predicted ATP-dependent endonuclease of OLD family